MCVCVFFQKVARYKKNNFLSYTRIKKARRHTLGYGVNRKRSRNIFIIVIIIVHTNNIYVDVTRYIGMCGNVDQNKQPKMVGDRVATSFSFFLVSTYPRSFHRVYLLILEVVELARTCVGKICQGTPCQGMETTIFPNPRPQHQRTSPGFVPRSHSFSAAAVLPVSSPTA